MSPADLPASPEPYDLIHATTDDGPTVLAITAEFLPQDGLSAATLTPELRRWMPPLGSYSVGESEDTGGLRIELTVARVHDAAAREQLIAWLRAHPALVRHEEFHCYGNAVTRGLPSSVTVERRARITWSPAHVARGLLSQAETIDPAWPPGTVPGEGDSWSLVCRFAPTPAEQGSPSVGTIRFWVPQAPHDVLRPGAILHLFERATGQYARVEVLE